ncbi:hypothetical protein H2509_20395 [Stappia sp. F7233]|uniref:Uncharacterized protein n=1 Tax=Stappia albiluteola TaxID=2758565 RepID=A0A839AL17_9HYPH|nr:hypothetical protein [Stappia albiluteola]MBA5779497.1 hypothetical protein [Stappia albiluteola]
MRPANEARGEVAVTVGGVDLILCATLGGLAGVSAATKSETFAQMFRKICGGEPNAIIAVVQSWTVEGDAVAALKAMKIPDMMKIASAAERCMDALMGDAAGNADAGAEKS